MGKSLYRDSVCCTGSLGLQEL